MFSPAQTRILPLMLTCAITVGGPAVAAASDEWAEPSRPHNYSISRDSHQPGQGLTGEAASVPIRRDAAELPDLGADSAGNTEPRVHMPYGSGYEARQRSGAFGANRGGGGRGMGRRR